MTRIVCWNIGKKNSPWEELLEMDVDVALLQEASRVPPDLRRPVEAGPQDPWEPWEEGLYDRGAMVVKLSERVEIEWFKRIFPVSHAKRDEIPVSGIGTIAAARVIPLEGKPFIVVSMYARWIRPHVTTGTEWRVGYPDGSAHRIISDLSAFIGDTDPSTHRILAAGDLNTIYGATDDNRLALPARDRTIFERMNALGLEFMGPQYPNGRRAEPTPQGLPGDTKNVPTFFTTRQSPATAQNQLDYVFASRGFHRGVAARALNGADEWGSSDHCRLLIDVGPASAIGRA